MKQGRLRVAPLVLVLAGCSAPGVVRYPADEQSAKLRYVFSGAESTDTYLWRVDRSNCPGAAETVLIASTGELEKSAVAMYGSSAEAQRRVREINMPAVEPLTFYLRASRYPAESCDNAGVFQPLPGRQYELRYIIEPTTFVCVVQIDELRDDGNGQVTRHRESSAHYFHPPKQSQGYCAEAPRAR